MKEHPAFRVRPAWNHERSATGRCHGAVARTRHCGAASQAHAAILAAFARLDSEAATARLDDAGIAWAEVNDMAALWRHPQLQALGRLIEVQSPAGPVAALKPPGNNSSHAPKIGPIPAVGEHTRAILGELGYREAEINALQKKKVI